MERDRFSKEFWQWLTSHNEEALRGLLEAISTDFGKTMSSAPAAEKPRVMSLSYLLGTGLTGKEISKHNLGRNVVDLIEEYSGHSRMMAPPPSLLTPEEEKGLRLWWERYWQSLDNLFFETVKRADLAFKTNLYINVAIAAVGLVLVGYTIVYSVFKGIDIFSVLFASVGLAQGVYIFWRQPQSGIHEALGNRTQIQIVHRTYQEQLLAIRNYAGAAQPDIDYGWMLQWLAWISREAIELIQTNVESSASPATQPQSQGAPREQQAAEAAPTQPES